MGLSKRTNHRGAEILADTFKVSRFTDVLSGDKNTGARYGNLYSLPPDWDGFSPTPDHHIIYFNQLGCIKHINTHGHKPF